MVDGVFMQLLETVIAGQFGADRPGPSVPERERERE